MDANLLERIRQLAYDYSGRLSDSGKLSPEKSCTVRDLLVYLDELEEKVRLLSFCPFCGKGLTQKNS